MKTKSKKKVNTSTNLSRLLYRRWRWSLLVALSSLISLLLDTAKPKGSSRGTITMMIRRMRIMMVETFNKCLIITCSIRSHMKRQNIVANARNTVLATRPRLLRIPVINGVKVSVRSEDSNLNGMTSILMLTEVTRKKISSTDCRNLNRKNQST